jgi:hypothetical protein
MKSFLLPRAANSSLKDAKEIAVDFFKVSSDFFTAWVWILSLKRKFEFLNTALIVLKTEMCQIKHFKEHANLLKDFLPKNSGNFKGAQ